MLFADHIDLLALSVKCEAAGMRISISMSEVNVLEWKMVSCPFPGRWRPPVPGGGV